jgi:DNA-binding NarL/FixJ family response regulator
MKAPRSKAKPPPKPPRTRILLVDDHPMARAGIAGFVNAQPDLEVCCEASGPKPALEALSRGKPDLMITDLTMPGRSGVEFIKDVLALHPGLPILVVSMHDEAVYGERALRAGARGYLTKEAGGEKLVLAIRRILEGHVYASESLSARLLEMVTGRRPRGSNSPIEKLSDREFEVFQLIGQGKSTKEIAAELSLSSKTVDVHRGHLKEKLGINDATSLIRYAVRWAETGRADA